MKPTINSVEGHPQLNYNGHPVDGALVGASLMWPVLAMCQALFVAQPCSQSLPLFHPTNDQPDGMIVLGHPRELVLSNVLVGQMYVFSGVWLTNLPHASSKVFSFVFEST
jgi:hypothetical protein